MMTLTEAGYQELRSKIRVEEYDRAIKNLFTDIVQATLAEAARICRETAGTHESFYASACLQCAERIEKDAEKRLSPMEVVASRVYNTNLVDAVRYRWLREHAKVVALRTEMTAHVGYLSLVVEPKNLVPVKHQKDLDEQIDQWRVRGDETACGQSVRIEGDE